MGVSDIGMDKPEVGEYARPRSGGARLLCAITQCSFLHIAHLVIKLVTLLDKNKSEICTYCDMDSTSTCMKTLRTENEIPALWDLHAPPATVGEPRLCR